jgi:hypothetical protein
MNPRRVWIELPRGHEHEHLPRSKALAFGAFRKNEFPNGSGDAMCDELAVRKKEYLT